MIQPPSPVGVPLAASAQVAPRVLRTGRAAILVSLCILFGFDATAAASPTATDAVHAALERAADRTSDIDIEIAGWDAERGAGFVRLSKAPWVVYADDVAAGAEFFRATGRVRVVGPSIYVVGDEARIHQDHVAMGPGSEVLTSYGTLSTSGVRISLASEEVVIGPASGSARTPAMSSGKRKSAADGRAEEEKN